VILAGWRRDNPLLGRDGEGQPLARVCSREDDCANCRGSDEHVMLAASFEYHKLKESSKYRKLDESLCRKLLLILALRRKPRHEWWVADYWKLSPSVWGGVCNGHPEKGPTEVTPVLRVGPQRQALGARHAQQISRTRTLA